MQCIKCGATLEDGYQVCKRCGTPVRRNNQNNDIKLNVVDDKSNENSLKDAPTIHNNFDNKVDTSSNDVDKSVNTNSLEFDSNNIKLDDIDMTKSEDSFDSDDYVDNDYSNKKSKLKYIVVGFGALLIVAVALVCVKFIPSKDTEVNPSEPVENIVTYNKLSFKNFVFSIPDKYVFSTSGDVLSISDYDGNIGMQIEISSGDYSKLVSKKDELSKSLEKKGYVSTKADTRSEDGVEYLTMEVSASGQNILLAVTKGNSSNYFTISLFNKSNNIDYELLEEVTKFLKLTEEVKSNNKLTSKNTYSKEFESIAK